MSLDGTQRVAQMFDPANSDGEGRAQLDLSLRELAALMVVLHKTSDEVDEMVETITASHGEAVSHGYWLAYAGLTLRAANAMAKATGFTEGRNDIARVGARLDQQREEWRSS